jgi:hypothetical protein
MNEGYRGLLGMSSCDFRRSYVVYRYLCWEISQHVHWKTQCEPSYNSSGPFSINTTYEARLIGGIVSSLRLTHHLHRADQNLMLKSLYSLNVSPYTYGK